MKKIILFIFCFVLFVNAHAQDTLQAPPQKLRAELVLSDVVMKKFSLSTSYRYAKKSAIEAQASILYGFANLDESDRFLGQPYSGYYVGLAHKTYLQETSNQHFSFFRASVGYQKGSVEYQAYDWITEFIDGITYYTYGLDDKEYIISSMILKSEVGIELYFNPFFIEFSAGLSYRGELENKPIPNNFRKYRDITSVNYIGFAPCLGFRLGLYLD